MHAAPAEFSTLSLHDALPISLRRSLRPCESHLRPRVGARSVRLPAPTAQMALRRVSTAGGALLASFAARGRTRDAAGPAVALQNSVVLSGGHPLRSAAAEPGARPALGRPVVLLPGGLQ